MPPGQHVTEGFPVLSAGPTPHTPLEDWTFSIAYDGKMEKSWTWQEFQALPAETVTVDIHCVTRWSKLGTQHATGKRRPPRHGLFLARHFD
jgi:DMSO/TMAO reductase YedYZ molybdopterin-dependent catalytic subunit